MSASPRKTTTVPANELLQPAQALSETLIKNCLEAQTMGLQAWLAWQRSMNEMTQELWDEWRVHFAGGAPLGD